MLLLKFDFYFFLIALHSHVTSLTAVRHSSHLQLSMPPTFSVLCSVCQKLPELVFKRLSFSLKVQKPLYPFLLTVCNFTSMISKPAVEDEPKQCSAMERSVLCRPEELILQPKGCKSNTSLNPIHLNHFTCF